VVEIKEEEWEAEAPHKMNNDFRIKRSAK